MPKEQYMCQLCANHGIFNQPKKGHKQKCPYRNCPCGLCALNTKRRALDQIERQLRQNSTDGKEEVFAPVQLPPCVSLPPTMVPMAVKEVPKSAPYSIALPAKMSRKVLPKEEAHLRPKNLEAVLDSIKAKSIFHSAEQLAG